MYKLLIQKRFFPQYTSQEGGSYQLNSGIVKKLQIKKNDEDSLTMSSPTDFIPTLVPSSNPQNCLTWFPCLETKYFLHEHATP